MDARKLLRIELTFHAPDGFAEQVRLLPDVQPHILTFGFDPVNLFGFQEESSTTGFDYQTLGVTRSGLQLFQQGKRLLVEISSSLVGQPGFCALKRLFETAAIERLHQVVDGRHFKSAKRILIICCDKNYKRDASRREGLEHIEAIDLRHLDIEKHKIRSAGTDRLDRLFAVRAVAENFDLGVARKHSPDLPPGKRLIVDDDSANAFWCGHAIAASSRPRAAWAVSKGISMVTLKPPSGMSDISNEWPAPYIW